MEGGGEEGGSSSWGQGNLSSRCLFGENVISGPELVMVGMVHS